MSVEGQDTYIPPLEGLENQDVTPQDTQSVVDEGVRIAQVTGKEQEYKNKRQETLGDVRESIKTAREGREALRGDTEVVILIQETFGDIEIDESILAGQTQEEAKQSFINFITHLGPEEQAGLKLLFSNQEQLFKIKDYFIEEGFINAQTYNDFKSEFEIPILETVVNEIEIKADEVKEQDEVSKQLFLSQLDSLSKLSDLNEASELSKLISNLETSEDLQGDLSEINKFLGEGPDSNLWKILKAFKELDEANAISGTPTNYYAEFSGQLKNSSPEMAAQIRTFEVNFGISHPLEKSTSIDRERGIAGLPPGVTPTISGNTLSAPDGQGNIISVDMSEQPPRRFIGTGENNYKLETDLPVDTMYGPTVKYENAKNNLTPKIDTLSQIIDYVGTLTDTTPISEAISSILSGLSYTFKTNNPDIITAIESSQSINDLQNLASTGVLFAKKTEFERELADVEEQYRTDLADAQASYRERIQERDENVKKTLDFLKSIGFTDLPQSLTDTVISQLNQNPALRAAVGFNAGEINLAEGQLGVEDIGAGEGVDDINNRIVFAKLVNKMIGVKDAQGNPPINVERMRAGGAPVGDTLKFTALLSESGLLGVGGVATALANLQKVES